jgi:hypothetical protein
MQLRLSPSLFPFIICSDIIKIASANPFPEKKWSLLFPFLFHLFDALFFLRYLKDVFLVALELLEDCMEPVDYLDG